MHKIILYSYPPLLLLSLVQACTPSLKIDAIISGALFASGILLLPIWILALVTHVHETSADDDLYDDYSIDIHIGRGRRKKRHGSD